MPYVYVCRNCHEKQSEAWKGLCPICHGLWSAERKLDVERGPGQHDPERGEAFTLEDLDDVEDVKRLTIGKPFEQVDEVFGGGIAEGDLISLVGDRGAGKSTFLMQLLEALGKRRIRCLYGSAEESSSRLRQRAKRLGCKFNHYVNVVEENDLDVLMEHAEEFRPLVIVIDSFQTFAVNDYLVPGSSASLASIFETVREYKQRYPRTTFILIYQVSKDGSQAGPNWAAHGVDAIMRLDKHADERRVFYGEKNRNGSTDVKAWFVMTDSGLKPVQENKKLEEEKQGEKKD